MDGCGAVWLDPEIPYVFFPKISGECHKKNGTLFVATIYLQFHTCFRFVKYTVPQGVCMLYQSWVGWAPLLGEVYPAIGPDNFKAAWWLLWKTFCVPWIWRALKQQLQISSQFKYWMWYRNHRKILDSYVSQGLLLKLQMPINLRSCTLARIPTRWQRQSKMQTLLWMPGFDSENEWWTDQSIM